MNYAMAPSSDYKVTYNEALNRYEVDIKVIFPCKKSHLFDEPLEPKNVFDFDKNNYPFIKCLTTANLAALNKPSIGPLTYSTKSKTQTVATVIQHLTNLIQELEQY